MFSMDTSFSPQPSRKKHFSPWVCHFHVCKVMQSGNCLSWYMSNGILLKSSVSGIKYNLSIQDILKKRRLKMNSVIHSLNMRCDSVRQEGRMNLPSLQIITQYVSSSVDIYSWFPFIRYSLVWAFLSKHVNLRNLTWAVCCFVAGW